MKATGTILLPIFDVIKRAKFVKAVGRRLAQYIKAELRHFVRVKIQLDFAMVNHLA
jgi:hypothetical protein